MEDFYDHYGYIGNIKNNYDEYMKILKSSGINLVKRLNNFELELLSGQTISIPRMTKAGTFILDDKEIYLISQEIKMYTEMFVTDRTCKVNICESYHRLSVKLEYTNVILNFDSLYKNLEYKCIPVNISFLAFFEYLEVTTINLLEMLEDLTDARTSNTILTILSCTDEYAPISDKNGEIIREKSFNGCTKEQMLKTILVAMIKCTEEPYDRDSYQFKYIKSAPVIAYNALKGCKEGVYTKAVEKFIAVLRTGNVSIRGKTYSKMASIISRRSNIDGLTIVYITDAHISRIFINDCNNFTYACKTIYVRSS